ncbi:hypothetical protein Snoj_73990 [Streptomyces nojiriensis]|uniref:Uncharacterized protein n=1 Tax=Streptomyces nojiriensis TaxID=66374 RepID=A0ABQ3SZC4_9ACTN|nr:hypothetical protein [Streptomyces nojiriensis]QTI46993.1 hypothetical protein JYK04_04834 [Streptomyces nojiriensis]GGS19102.1 hypothetical protein GCM10010205_56390 [Streptomyces nojiriensis]GHI73481.1 hypothetical protein Snoj_73990 [Streptomyces nojiriensis]
MTRTPQPATVPASRIRSRSLLAALLFLPALFVVKILVLATDTGGRCFVDDIECAPFPVGAFGALLAALVVSFVVATAAPGRAGRIALAAQVALEAVAVLLVLAFP